MPEEEGRKKRNRRERKREESGKGTADRKENAAETEWEDCRIGERR